MKNKFLSRIGQWHTPPYLRKCLTSLKALTLLLVMLMSVNVWGAEGDVLAEVQGTGSSYGRQTTTDSYNVGWVTIGQSGYFGINKADNNTGAKAGVNATDLPVAKAVNADATSSTSTTSNSCTGYYTFYTTTALENVGSIEFYYSANSGNSDATAYVVMGDAKSASGGAAYVQVPLATSSTSKQGVSLGTSGTFTFTFAETQKDAKYYGVVIATSSYKRMTGGKITIKEGAGDTPAAELVSIAISGTPNKTTYETGESFDVSDLTVTGTYSDASTDDLTDDAEWTIDPATFTSTSQTSVSVTATVGEKSDTKPYNVTVTEHVVTPGTYEISLNNALYGISTGSNGTEQSAKVHDITVVSGCSSSAGSKTYYDANHIRYYADSYLKLSVPAGYEITSVVFTSGGTWNGSGISVNTGSYSDTDNKTWTGNAQEVDFSMSAQCRAAKITVTYAAPKVVSGIAVKTNPTKTTYYVGDDFDPAGLVITASYTDESAEDIAYTEDNKDAFSFSGFNSEAVATDQVITVTYAEKSATFTVNIEEARTLNSITVASNPDKMVYEVGEALDLTGLVVNGNFSKGDPEPVGYTADPADGTTLDATGTTTVTLTSVDNTELTTSFDVTVNAIEGDRITLAETGVTGSSYVAWESSYTAPSGAVYTGVNAGSNNTIQLRSDATSSKPASGIISTTSGGLLQKVKVVWNTSTANDRELEVFGSNTAYTAVADLVDNTKKGTSLGTIKKGTSTELVVSGEYAYVGIRSKSGAMYLDNVTFIWSAPKELVSIAVKTAPTVVNYADGEFFNPAGLVITATYDDETAADIAYEGNEDKFSFSPALDVALATTDEQVTITYGGKSCNQTITVKNIELTSIVVSGDLTKTEYTEGDDFDFTGLVATGYYSDESHKTITDQVDWSIDPATLTAGQISVKVIATMNEISGDETYDITVNEAPKYATFSGTAGSDVVFTTGSSSADGAVWAGSPCAKGIITLTGAVTSGSNYSYYDGSVVRFYTNNNLVLTPANGYKITKIEIVRQSTTGNNGGTINCVGLTADENNTTTNTNIFTGSTKGAVTFTATAQARFTSISVHYATAAPSAATPTITPSVEAETYFDNITVTLASEGADAIYYTTNGDAPTTASALYENPIAVSATTTIKAIAVKDGLDNSEVATKTFNFGPVFTSLEDLAAADLTSGTTVKVSFENVEIKSIFTSAGGKRQGIYFDIQKGGKDIEIYYASIEVPGTWVEKGTVSGTMTCPWKNFSGTWELAPDANSWNWSNLTYNAPAVTGLTKVEVEGAPDKTTYVDGEKFNPAGLTIYATIDDVRAEYDGSKGEVIYTVTPETLTESTTSVSVVATIGTVSSEPYEVTGLTVTAIQQSTIADFISNEGGRCYLIGTVSDFNSSTKRFNLTDATGTLYIYSHSLATGITEVANDDYIKVLAETYNTTYENAENVVVVEKLEKPHVAVTGISLNKTETSITIGKTETLVATIEPADASDKEVIWTSNNEAVATVEGGVVSAVAAGDAVITAKSHENEEITATCNVTVVAAQVKYFALATSTADLDAAVTNGKKVVIAPATSETAAVVMGTYVSGNNIKAIEANYADERVALEVGEDAFYTIAKEGDYYTFQDGNGKYIYAAGGTSSNHLKAYETLDDKGRWNVSITDNVASVVCKEAATTRNTMQFNPNGDNPMFACYGSASQKAIALYVEADKPQYIPVESIVLNETSAEVMVGKKLTLTATVGPDNATQKGVTWTSDNDKVTVEDGVVTVDAEAEVGTTATITATTVGTTTDGGTEHLSATCVITVTELVGTKYGLVSSINTLYDGAVVVLGAVYEKDDEPIYVVNQGFESKYLKAYKSIDEESDLEYENEVMLTANASEITLKKADEGWLLLGEDGKYINGAADLSQTDDIEKATVWAISIEDGVATIASETNVIKYNTSAPRFKTYGSGQTSIGIYMKNLVAVRNGLTAGKIATYCETRGASIYDGAAFFEILNKDANSKNVTLQEADEQLFAGMPYIIEPTHNILKVVFEGDAVTDATNKNGLYGWLNDEPLYFDSQIDGKDAYLVSGGRIVRCGDNCTLLTNRAYVILDEVASEENVAPVPGRRLMKLGVDRSMPTGFETIMMQKGMNKVIMNNQLYLIRDGKLFNAQGALVK